MTEKNNMKKLILLCTFLSLNISVAKTYNVDHIKNLSDFYGVFILTSKSQSEKIKLDCQSYFQKLDFLDANDNIIFENYITYGECEYLYENFNQCLSTEKAKCVDSEDIFNQDCSCN